MSQDAPSCLAENGRRLWDATVSGLSETQREMLLLACKQFDRAAESRVLLQSDEIVGEDRFGQQKPHPAVQIERAASMACAKIIGDLLGRTMPAEPVADEFFD